MQRLVQCLQAQHRTVEESLESVARLALDGQRDDCLRLFRALAARITWQLHAEEELLFPLYAPHPGELRERLLVDHRELAALVAGCRRRIEEGDWSRFADDAQELMLKFALHAAREERALASVSQPASGAVQESAVGLFVERMAPKA